MKYTPLEFLRQSLPLPAIRQVVRVRGSIVSIDFGGCKKMQNNLTITYCDWILCHNDSVILDCIDADQNLYDNILPDLCDKKILNIKKMENQHVIKIVLEDSYYFLLTANFDYYDEDDDLFFLLQEGKSVVFYSPDKGFSFEIQ